MAVKIQRTSDSIILTLPSSMEVFDIQSIINRFKVLEILSRSKATNDQLDELVRDSKSNWSPQVKDRLSQMDEFKDLF